MRIATEITEKTARGKAGLSEAEIATIDAARAILRRHVRSTVALQSWMHLKWSQESGQSAKVYPKPLKGYENGEAPELYRPV